MIQGINLAAPHASGKPLINLGLGDPSVFGNMPPAPAALDAIEAALRSGKADGYPQSTGYPAARQAVADYFDESAAGGNWRLTADDVVLTHGTSGALEMCISVLADETKNVVFPRPLFTAYETSTYVSKAKMRYYSLRADQDWEVDLASLEAQIDSNTAFVILTNPGNPTGSNFSEAHLREIAALMARKQVLVVADEVYAGLAWDVTGPRPDLERPIVQGKFNRRAFTPYASICGDAPVLTCGGLSKRWLAPGWRLGWLLVHDPLKVMDDVREGLGRWAVSLAPSKPLPALTPPAELASHPFPLLHSSGSRAPPPPCNAPSPPFSPTHPSLSTKKPCPPSSTPPPSSSTASLKSPASARSSPRARCTSSAAGSTTLRSRTRSTFSKPSTQRRTCSSCPERASGWTGLRRSGL